MQGSPAVPCRAASRCDAARESESFRVFRSFKIAVWGRGRYLKLVAWLLFLLPAAARRARAALGFCVCAAGARERDAHWN